jgi:polygalacturonase
VTHGVNIQSKGIDNGDGWDPDSSQNLLIFDTVFDTGDDCIAIKSGKNPEGNQINRPAKNIRLFDLAIRGGHGIAIGSEQSGGVENISFRDCQLTNTLYGLELKAQNDRGGYIRQSSIACWIVSWLILLLTMPMVRQHNSYQSFRIFWSRIPVS